MAPRTGEQAGSQPPRPRTPGYDDSAWPLVRVVPPPPGSTEEAFRRHLDNLDLAFARGEAFAVLVDARGFPPLAPRERRLVADRIKKNQAPRPLLKGMAILIESRIQRGVVTAINWLARPAYPTQVFEREVEARRWLFECLGKAET